MDLKFRQELKNVLHHKELLWKQKARCDWLHLRDRNTKFFHSCTLQRRKNNRIFAICNTDGDWIYDPETIKAKANIFFQKLYGEHPSDMGHLPSSKFPQLE